MQRIQARIDDQLCSHNSKQETMVLNYFREHLPTITGTSATQISDDLYCSSTTISRTVKKLGFNNYREFQMAINILGKEEITDVNHSKIYSMFRTIISNSNCIYVYGKGGDFIPSLHLFRRLLTMEYDVSIVCFQDLLVNLRNKTLIVIVDHNCDDFLLEILKKNISNGCNILAISTGDSNINTITDNVLNYNTDSSLSLDNNQQIIHQIDELLTYI